MNKLLHYDDVLIGPQIEPIKRLYQYSDKEWEEFIEEWLDIRKSSYIEVERLGGAGDKGRDVIAYIDKNIPNYTWDCYQCKHYLNPITPSDIWSEFGKILYFTYKKDYPIPRKYYFVAPKGVGVSLTDLLNNPDNLKKRLNENWDKSCKKNISAIQEVVLEGEFLEYFNKFDFSIFERILPKLIISEHLSHPNHIKRFGGGLPRREKCKIPDEIQKYELQYIDQLIKAYNTDNATNSFKSLEDFNKLEPYGGHFNRARESFHTAEQLRNFSRDTLGEEIFEDFQNEIYHGVIDISENNEKNKFHNVKKVEQEAMKITIESNPLKSRCGVIDKKGICHQLVNESKIKWVQDNE